MLEVTIFGWHVNLEAIIQDIYYLVTVCKHLEWHFLGQFQLHLSVLTQVVSVAGDGGFLFSAQDLETAVRKT